MRRIGVTLLAAAALAFAFAQAGAQDKFPSKPVKILVPYAPGGATDIVARIVGEQMRQSLGQSFVVENKPGAFGILAIEEMARARPDGYTVQVGNVSTNAITPVIVSRQVQDQLRSRRRAGDQPDRRAGIPGGDDDQLCREGRQGAHRLRQEEPRQAALRHGRRRQLSALRHGLFRQAGGRP